MNKKIEKIEGFRRSLIQQTKDLTSEQMNYIPTGFSNNIIWNIGHLTSTLQILCYVRSGLPITIDEKYFSPYLSGTKPQRIIQLEECAQINELFLTSIAQLQTDVAKQIFKNYSPSAMIPKVYAFEVNNIDDALEYLLFHEGYHYAIVLMLLKKISERE
jgi:hypothetical protein